MNKVLTNQRLYGAAFVLGAAAYFFAFALGVYESMITRHRVPAVGISYWPDVQALRSRQDQDRRIAQLRLAAELDPLDRHMILNQLGLAYASKGEFEQAISHYRQALENQSDPAKVHANLGIALFSAGKQDAAIKHFRAAIKIKPDYAIGHFNLAMALQDQNELEEAIRHYRAALKSTPHDSQSHENLGIALAAQGEMQQAIGHFRQAVKITPDNASLLFNLARAVQSVGQIEEAIGYYRRSLQITPDDPQVLNKLARLLAVSPDPKLRRPDEAIQLARRASEIRQERDPQVLSTLAAAYAAAGKLELAIETAEAALKLATAAGDESLSADLRARLQRYQQPTQ